MAAMLRWMALTFARFVGLSVTILGGWLVLGQAAQGGPVGSFVALIVAFGVIGMISGLAYLFSFDGPAPFRARWVRVLSWAGMMVSVLLPTSLRVMLVPMVVLVFPSVFLTPRQAGQAHAPVTSE
jgi:hypothetical protein